jgi:hypothetical protein
MRIALIGPGIMPIPPNGWGAVEILIWDYYQELTRLGNDVTIINTPNQTEIIERVNAGEFDFVHLHYDVFYPILYHLRVPKIAVTTHYPYIDVLLKHHGDGYQPIFDFLVKQNFVYQFVLAEKDMQTFLRFGANPDRLKKIKNGIDSSLFQFQAVPPKFNKTVYLGKITPRKNQAKYQSLKDVDFVGNIDDSRFDTSRTNYLGEWSRDQIHQGLTNYGNLLLISNGEADPLVVKEALIAGLGVVMNQSSAENLEKDVDFITILEESRLNDFEYIQQRVEENRKLSLKKRTEIREYGIRHFDISQEVRRYLQTIEGLV